MSTTTTTAPPVPTELAWTASARDEIRRRGLDATGSALILPADVQVDDYVELSGDRGASTFIVRRRFWRCGADGTPVLRIELDHPPRPSGLR